MSLANSASHFQSQEFRGRVRAAMVSQALVVYGEATTVTDHDVRYRLALAVITDPWTGLVPFTTLCANDDALAVVADHNTVPDATVSTLVRNFWTPVAKVILPPVV